MTDHCFMFLKDEFPKISYECESCERHLVEKNYEESLFRAGKACELITKYVANVIGKPEYNELNQKKRLKKLFSYYGVIPFEYESSFHKIRVSRNKVAHDEVSSPENYSFQMHKRLFKICLWFYNQYSKGNSLSLEYNGPIYVSNKIDGKEIIGKIDLVSKEATSQYNDTKIELEKIKNELETLKNRNNEVNVINNNDNLSDYDFNKKQGSYLLNELSKLSIFSPTAVENEDILNEFKNYIHVDRSIQNEFISEVERVVNEDSSHLIMLCGNVGDGKSHLLGYLSTHYPNLYNKFIVHGDATVSYYTNETYENTLSEFLTPFNDKNMNVSSEKLILAINLGILNNFLESDLCSKEYSKLKKIIEDVNLFDSEIISQNIIQDKVSIITFTDYNLFELNDDSDLNYVSSNYIKELITKITHPDEFENPFYRAYLMDKNLGYKSPIIYNYELFCDEEVQKVIVEYIIRVFVEHKKIISTRDLFNTFYELLVPPVINDYSIENSVDDFVEYLLPNMLFNNQGRSNLLKLLSTYDPTQLRSEKLDEFIIKFNTNTDLYSIIKENFNVSKLDLLNSYFDEYIDLSDCSYSGKNNLIRTLVRLAVFYGKQEFKQTFIDKDYLTYLKYLYFYNTQNRGEYRTLFSEIKKAIFKLKGSIKKDYISIDEFETFKVSKELKLNYYPDIFDIQSDSVSNRFKTSIKVYFSVYPTKNKIPLDVDYSLYSAICKLNRGYRPNTLEKEKLILFEEFINALINETSSDYLFIKKTDVNSDYTFQYIKDEYDESFDSFIFEKGG